MSSRSRPPAHQNAYAFKHNPNSKKTKKIMALPNTGVCGRCRDIIEWRKKYRKYRPLTKPGKCVGCNLPKVKHAYHNLCDTCAEARGVCAKCMEKEALSGGDAERDAIREEISILENTKGAIPGISERERRTMLREAYRRAEAAGMKVEKIGGGRGDDSDGEAAAHKHGKHSSGRDEGEGDEDGEGSDGDEDADGMAGGIGLSAHDEAAIASLKSALKVARARQRALDAGAPVSRAAAAASAADAPPPDADEAGDGDEDDVEGELEDDEESELESGDEDDEDDDLGNAPATHEPRAHATETTIATGISSSFLATMLEGCLPTADTASATPSLQ